MLPSMRKVRIFCSDPDATDSSDEEDDQNPKKEKKLIGEVLIPLKKEPSSRYRGEPSDDEDDQNPKKEKKLIGEVLVPLKKEPSSRYCCEPSDDEDDQNPKKEKKLIGGVLAPLKKEPSSRFRGVRRRSWGGWQAEIRNPFTKKKESTTYKTEEEAAAAYQEKRKKYDAMKAKAQLSVPEFTALSSSSSLSCMSTSILCKQKEQEAHNGVGVSKETGPEPTDESIQNFSPTPKEISVNALLGQIGELPVSFSAIPADKHSPTDESILNSPTPKEISVNALLDQVDELPVSDSAIPADKHSPKDAFPISDFIGATYEPLDDDYIGLADISHLPLPFEDPEFDLDAESDWSCFDLASIELELNDK